MEKTALNERPLLGSRIVSLNVRVWAKADVRRGDEPNVRSWAKLDERGGGALDS
jgi:hypothetical protein